MKCGWLSIALGVSQSRPWNKDQPRTDTDYPCVAELRQGHATAVAMLTAAIPYIDSSLGRRCLVDLSTGVRIELVIRNTCFARIHRDWQLTGRALATTCLLTTVLGTKHNVSCSNVAVVGRHNVVSHHQSVQVRTRPLKRIITVHHHQWHLRRADTILSPATSFFRLTICINVSREHVNMTSTLHERKRISTVINLLNCVAYSMSWPFITTRYSKVLTNFLKATNLRFVSHHALKCI